MDTWNADREEEDILRQDAVKAESLQELARQGKVFICYGPISKEKLRELELAKLKRWNASSARWNMDIIRITEEADHLHVELVAASEMSFDLMTNGDETAIDDICRVAPSILRLDGDLMEMYDDAGRTQPHREDLEAVNKFLMRWRSNLNNSELAIPGFPEPGQ